MNAIDILRDFIEFKKIKKGITQSKLNTCNIEPQQIHHSLHEILELDLKRAKYKYTIKLIEEDILYLEAKLKQL